MTDVGVTLRDISEAAKRITPFACRPPLKPSRTLSRQLGQSVSLKLETVQATGSFKLRGAANLIASLTPEAREHGLVTTSAGNHGRAVAYVAEQLGIRAVIFLSERVPVNKVQAIRELGAEVVIAGRSFDEAVERAEEYRVESGMTDVPPFDDPRIVAGAGTIGLELLDDLPQLETVVLPVGGGGLAAGVAFAVKAHKPSVRVIGVMMERGPAMYESLKAGRPVAVEEEPTLADALAGGIGLDNRVTFPLVREYVDEIMLVTEEQIAAAMAFALRRERLVLEGAGACGLALLCDPRAHAFDGPIAVVCSGDNVDINLLLDLARDHPEP
jgi:threonine dehydratase